MAETNAVLGKCLWCNSLTSKPCLSASVISFLYGFVSSTVHWHFSTLLDLGCFLDLDYVCLLLSESR
jgi:hypothetical protein